MKSICRICGSDSAREAGEVEYLRGYAWMVYDCDACGCRFTQHDESVHEAFHATGAISYYSSYRDLAARIKKLFDERDIQGIRHLLCQTDKYRFVIEQIDKLPASASILEAGCSRGYLTSMFILQGKDIHGVDVSAEAIECARRDFGDHFAVAGTAKGNVTQTYDCIYHVGMIGCVSDPLVLTRQFLGKLKPGGTLLFNAPNRAACHLKDQLWLDSAPPPDLVTLFPAGFWERQLGDAALVEEKVELSAPEASLRVMLDKWLGVRWRKPQARPLAASNDAPRIWFQPKSRARQLFERIVIKVARLTGLLHSIRRVPSDFGLFVKMTVK